MSRFKPRTNVLRQKWGIGAWTPRRCALYATLPPDRQLKMVHWVLAEKERGKCYENEIPVQEAEK